MDFFICTVVDSTSIFDKRSPQRDEREYTSQMEWDSNFARIAISLYIELLLYTLCTLSVCLCVRMCVSLSLASHFLESLSRKMPELRIWKLSQFGICALVCTCLCMCKEGWDNGNWKSSKMVGLRTNYRKIKCLIFFRGVEKSEDQVGMRIIVPVDTSGCSFWHLLALQVVLHVQTETDK